MVGEVIERCPTGIVGFDNLCQGGFVRNSDNVVIGGPGSGKSTFLMQFLWNGLTKYGENGLYCSFEPDILDTIEDARSFGWDFTAASAEGRIKFMRFAPQTSVDELKKELKKVIARHNIKRVCFDPISILALHSTDQGAIRQVIFELSSMMKRMKVTTIYADESLEGESMQSVIEGEWTKTDILRFLSDSVTILYETGITGVGERAIRIMKMRRTAHKRIPFGMNIMPTGIEVLGEDGMPVNDPTMIANAPLYNPNPTTITPPQPTMQPQGGQGMQQPTGGQGMQQQQPGMPQQQYQQGMPQQQYQQGMPQQQPGIQPQQ